jgi:hypothetical protein
MTNIVAAVIVTVATNWTHVGTLDRFDEGVQYKLLEGKRITNTTAIIEWRGQELRMLLERADGPVVGEKKEKIPQYWGIYTNLQPNIMGVSNIYIMATNYPSPWTLEITNSSSR